MSIDRFCNYIMWWALQRVKDADDFRRRINMPLPGMAPTAEQLAEEAAAFASFANAFGVRKPDAPVETA